MPNDLTFLQSATAHQATLRRGYWIAVSAAAVAVAVTASPASAESLIGALAVLVLSVLPGGLWVYGKAKGIPLLPVYALTHAWTFGLPLLYDHPIVLQFPPESQLVAALTVAGFLLLATIVWVAISRRVSPTPDRCIQLNVLGADYLFLAAMITGAVGTVVVQRQLLPLPLGVGSIVAAIILAVQALASFVLSYELGAGRLTGNRAALFIVLLVALVITQLPALLLIGAMSIVTIAVFGFTLGAGRFPWLSALAAVVIFAFLHVGKGAMRDKYWSTAGEDVVVPGPADYPVFFADWISTSATRIAQRRETNEEEGQSLLERASLMQLLLHVQATSPDSVPFLYGETYTILPTLLVPRILMPDKPASHEGTYILNIHYGFQTREATATTTIGFGLLNEAYANFGYAGVAMLAIVIGAFYGVVGRWAAQVPILSLRALFAVLVASYSFQAEFAAGVYLAALFQSTVALLLIAAVFMRRAPVQHRASPEPAAT